MSADDRIDEARAASLLRTSAALRAGADVSDAAFDAHLPRRYRWPSGRHWTPVAACREAARWLAPHPDSRVLDVGSGIGKLCVIGSLTTAATFVGIEQRPHLVHAARALAAQLGADSASFLSGDAFAADWREFDSLYFYNPFAEPLFPEPMRIDLTLPHSEAAHDLAIRRLVDKLAGLPVGARLVVYHDLGCALPDGYRRVEQKAVDHSDLELWLRD